MLDILAGVGFVVALAAIMGVFSRRPRNWGYPPPPDQPPGTGTVPSPRTSADNQAEHKVD